MHRSIHRYLSPYIPIHASSLKYFWSNTFELPPGDLGTVDCYCTRVQMTNWFQRQIPLSLVWFQYRHLLKIKALQFRFLLIIFRGKLLAMKYFSSTILLPSHGPRLHGSSIVAFNPVQLVSSGLKLQVHSSPPEGAGLLQNFTFCLTPGPQTLLHSDFSSSSPQLPSPRKNHKRFR